MVETIKISSEASRISNSTPFLKRVLIMSIFDKVWFVPKAKKY
jgi:hypothetical protein